MRVSAVTRATPHDSLTDVNVPRRCCRPGCPHYAVATLTFVYSDSTAVVGPLATVREPHSWDLCVSHASRITAPRGWELVRHSGPLPAPPEDEDLVALANAVREGGGQERLSQPGRWFPQASASAAVSEASTNGAVLASRGRHAAGTGRHAAGTGRRRGHLRVLPDPPD